MAVSIDAAFEGFRLTRQKPLTLLIWSGYFLVTTVVNAVLSVTLLAPGMQQLAHLGLTPSPEEAQAALPLLASVMPGALAVCLWAVVSYSVAQAAASRAVLRSEEDAFGYLRLGADEVRVCLSLLGFWGVLFAVYVGVVVGVSVLSAIGSLAGPAGAALVLSLGIVGVGVALTYVGVRLSLGPPMTLESGKPRLFASWEQTRGRFWPLLGAYAVSWVLALLVMMLMGVISLAVVASFLGGLTAAMDNAGEPAKATALAAYFTPARAVMIVFSAVTHAMMAAITASVPAAVLAQLRPPRASVFA